MERVQRTRDRLTNQDLIEKLRDFLGDIGIDFFRDIKKKYGKIDAVWMDGKIPHSVHFNEGMQIRNFLRPHLDLDAIELDEVWVQYIEEAIEEQKE